MLQQMQRVIIGQQEVLDLMLLGLFCQGHCILEGVPGLAKTLMISSLSQLLSLRFNRVQFTPDLMPSDITGTEILQEDKRTGGRELRFVKGPLFANLILADEINRTPPKTQAALLQAMQEFHVTVAGQTWELERPFFVLGTQNPIESEGTYPLPEAQLDRFMFKIKVGYPTLDDEVSIAMSTTSTAHGQAGAGDQQGEHPQDSADRSPRDRLEIGRPLRRAAGPRHASAGDRSRLRQALFDVGSRAAGVPGAAAGGEGPGAVGRPAARFARRRATAGQAGAAASDRDQFRGREREHQLGRHRRSDRLQICRKRCDARRRAAAEAAARRLAAALTSCLEN